MSLKEFNGHFEKIVETLKIDCPISFDYSDDLVLSASETFSRHDGVLKIK